MNKYPNGYLPKIQYWTERLHKAVRKGDMRIMELSAAKLKYFVERVAS